MIDKRSGIPACVFFAAAWLLAGRALGTENAKPALHVADPLSAAEAPADPRPPGRVEGRANSYQDDAGLYVTSVGAELEHPFFRTLSFRIKAVADWITIMGKPADPVAADPHAGHAGHEHAEEDDNPVIADAISGASARISTGSGNSRELRQEGILGLTHRGALGNRPITVSAEMRASHEPDYASLAGNLAGRMELFQGNTTVSAFVAAARDEISPARVPAGQQGRWPADQVKSSAGFSVAQILTPRLLVSGGASAALQTGRLSSPYRDALVDITYFPEKLPDSRLRATAFLQASWYLGYGTALHLRQGCYADDWDVAAWIPETAVAKEIGSRLLLTLKHRFYAQSPAAFYKAVYADRKGFQTGNLRLGTLYDQTGGAVLAYRFDRGAGKAGPIVLSAEYGFSRLEYPELYPRVLLSHVLSIGVRSDY